MDKKLLAKYKQFEAGWLQNCKAQCEEAYVPTFVPANRIAVTQTQIKQLLPEVREAAGLLLNSAPMFRITNWQESKSTQHKIGLTIWACTWLGEPVKNMKDWFYKTCPSASHEKRATMYRLVKWIDTDWVVGPLMVFFLQRALGAVNHAVDVKNGIVAEPALEPEVYPVDIEPVEPKKVEKVALRDVPVEQDLKPRPTVGPRIRKKKKKKKHSKSAFAKALGKAVQAGKPVKPVKPTQKQAEYVTLVELPTPQLPVLQFESEEEGGQPNQRNMSQHRVMNVVRLGSGIHVDLFHGMRITRPESSQKLDVDLTLFLMWSKFKYQNKSHLFETAVANCRRVVWEFVTKHITTIAT